MNEFDYPSDHRPAPPTPTKSGAVQWGTVVLAAVAAAVISALIVTIGVVGVLIAAPGDETPGTVVNLGATPDQTGTTPGTPGTQGAQGDGTAPTESVPDSGDTPSGQTPAPAAPGGPANGTAPGQTQAPTTSTASPTQSSDGSLPSNFRVIAANPTASDLNDIVRFLVATPASDEAKAANIEGGMTAVVVPRTVYTLGLFRAPLGWSQVSGPLHRTGDSVTAQLTSGSAGRPTIRLRIEFKRIDGNWRLAANSLCQGVKTVGLNIYCNA